MWRYYLRRLAGGEGIVVIGFCLCVWVCLSVSVRPAATARRNAASVSAAKVMRCIRCHAVCVSAALLLAAKVMRCIQCSLVTFAVA